MIKLLTVIALGLAVGAGGVAFAHDMNHMAQMQLGNAAWQVAAAEPGTVAIDNFAFAPATLTVAPGTTVTWINHDDEPHTIVNSGTPRLFKSAALDSDEKFSFKFDQPGTYTYFCSIHPQMTGTIVVK